MKPDFLSITVLANIIIAIALFVLSSPLWNFRGNNHFMKILLIAITFCYLSVGYIVKFTPHFLDILCFGNTLMNTLW